jgi:hypothetical protein|uniref:Thioredoxin domain-containing protein n=1 Tax=viral metagenome TaxID=1070528 RepID=A0A6C0JUY4_9ZZZZ
MILIYSNNCKHCNILLETIEKHDKEKIIKIISVDTLKANNYKVEEIIHSVPALILNDTINEENILYGKQVFDHLLLPNRGVLFTTNNTRLNKESKDSVSNVNIDDDIKNNGPSAFTLGTSLSDNFSFVDDNQEILKDKTYNWDLVDNLNNTSENNEINLNPVSSINDKIDKKLPSLEELMNQRSKDFL